MPHRFRAIPVAEEFSERRHASDAAAAAPRRFGCAPIAASYDCDEAELRAALFRAARASMKSLEQR
jgi:hypothetical protein